MAGSIEQANLPLPQQVPIQHADWNVGFNPSAYIPPSNDRTPVNPINAALAQQGQQAQIGAQQAQTANALSDVQQRQRQMQASIMGALAKAPKDQYEAARDRMIPVINGMNPSYQVDPNIDQGTLAIAAMGAVPVQEQPQYNITQTRANILSGMGGGQGMSDAERLAIASPESSNAIYNTPEGAAQRVTAEKNASNQVEAQKNAIESNEGYNQVKASLDDLKKIISSPDLPESYIGIPSSSQAWLSQNFGDQKAANAYSTFQKLNESQTIKAIQALADSNKIKMTDKLQEMVNRGYLVDPDASPQTKMDQANIADTELRNSAIAAGNVSAKMNGGATGDYGGATGNYGSPIAGSTVLKNAASQLPAHMQPKPQTNSPIPAGAIAFLKSNPQYAAAFEQKYGVKADKYLGSGANGNY